jgi:N,N'-diacetyllegionaminate synthase
VSAVVLAAYDQREPAKSFTSKGNKVPSGFDIEHKRLGPDAPLFVVAEIGLTEGGSIDHGVALVDAAAAAGASAVNLQTAPPDHVVAAAASSTHSCSVLPYCAPHHLDEPAQAAIAAHARARGLVVVATPSSLHALDVLERCGVDAYKIPSRDLTYLALIDHCARTRKPVILSTGMANLPEIKHALWTAHRAGAVRTALLHCVSASALPAGSDNLRALSTLAHTFRMPVGLSDHSRFEAAVPMAVALGATIYERHFRLDLDGLGATNGVSSTPAELAAIVKLAAEARAALGHGHKHCLPVESSRLRALRRSLRSTRRLAAGHVLTAEDIAVLGPQTGLAPACERDLVGLRLARSIETGAPFLACDLPFLEASAFAPYDEGEASPLAEAV